MPQKIALYVIYMPYTLEEYNVGHLATTCKVSVREAEKGMRVQVLKNQAEEHPEYGKCQTTLKVLDFSKKVPGIFRMVAPRNSLTLTETSYNAFPRCSTQYTSGAVSEKNFTARIDTAFFSGYRDPADSPFSTLPPAETCEVLDLLQLPQMAEDYNVSEYRDEMGAGVFVPGWEKRRKSTISIFKRVQVDFHLPFLGRKYVGDVVGFMRNIFIQGHQEILKYHGAWKSMDMPGVREEEARVKKELEEKYGS